MTLGDYGVIALMIICFALGLIAGGSLHSKSGAIAVYENRMVCESALGQWVCKEVSND